MLSLIYNIINEYTIWLIVRQKETAKCIHIKYGKMFLQIFTTCNNDFKHLILHWIPVFFSLSLTTLPYNWCYMKMYPVGRIYNMKLFYLLLNIMFLFATIHKTCKKFTSYIWKDCFSCIWWLSWSMKLNVYWNKNSSNILYWLDHWPPVYIILETLNPRKVNDAKKLMKPLYIVCLSFNKEE